MILNSREIKISVIDDVCLIGNLYYEEKEMKPKCQASPTQMLSAKTAAMAMGSLCINGTLTRTFNYPISGYVCIYKGNENNMSKQCLCSPLY